MVRGIKVKNGRKKKEKETENEKAKGTSYFHWCKDERLVCDGVYALQHFLFFHCCQKDVQKKILFFSFLYLFLPFNHSAIDCKIIFPLLLVPILIALDFAPSSWLYHHHQIGIKKIYSNHYLFIYNLWNKN